MTTVILYHKGQKAKGTLLKLNPKYAKIRLDEPLGRFKVGAILNGPYGCFTDILGKYPLPDGSVTDKKPNGPYFNQEDDNAVDAKPVDFKRPFFPENEKHIIRAIFMVQNQLSPENLTCDGERPRGEVNRRAAILNRKLSHLEAALGYKVDESQAWEAVQYWDKPKT